MELQVWGPAFGLPSGDAESLAAIAYLGYGLPRHSWVLVQGGIDMEGESPALRDGSKVVRDFEKIVNYVKERNGAKNLDAGLTPLQRADCLAFSTLLTTTAHPLVSLSLYISHKNYTHAVRPAYNATLSFPYTWIIPSRQKAEAASRTAHLGIANLDLDPDDPSNTREVEGIRIPGFAKKASISTTETASRIRLEALTRAVLDPLSELLKWTPEGKYFFGDEPTSLDCLALGYLSLFAIPDLPVLFLHDTLQKYPDLVSYLERGKRQCFNIPSTSPVVTPPAQPVRKRRAKVARVEDDDERKNVELSDSETEDDGVELVDYDNMAIGADSTPQDSSAPGQEAYTLRTGDAPGFLERVKAVVEAVMPDIEILKGNPVVSEDERARGDGDEQIVLPTSLVTIGAGAAVVLGGLVYTGIGGFKEVGRRGSGKVDLGEAGRMLGLGSAEVPLRG